MAVRFNLTKANRYIPHILLIGVGIATANYVMNDGLSWLQWVLKSILTSLIIGYSLVAIAANKLWFAHHLKPQWKFYLSLFLVFFLIGSIATEAEQLLQAFVLSNDQYQPFSAGNMYIFNGIISLVLGFSFLQNKQLFIDENAAGDQSQQELPTKEDTTTDKSVEPLSKIPVKQGESILLIPTQDIVYLEAFDNYSFIYDLTGKKRLCDYSLLFLQQRLDDSFLRVHRKHIVNTNHIKQIQPYSSARYQIMFDVSGLSPILSSKSYAGVVRGLIKIQ